MKTIFLGTVAFLLWAGFSNYWYICKIRGLCTSDGAAIQADLDVASNSGVDSDSYLRNTDTVEKTGDSVPKGNTFDNVYVKFDFGSDSIINEPDLQPFMIALKEELSGKEHAHVILVGHTDDEGEPEFNYLLGLQRAQALKKLMVARGFQENIIHVASRGEMDPLVDNQSEVNREKNRRVEVIVN